MSTATPKDDPGRAWRSCAGELADWALARLVNRADAWGAYRPEWQVGQEYTAPGGEVFKLGPQKTVRGQLTRALLARHFRAEGRADVIGLHTADADNKSKGGALDIDQHGDDPARAEVNLHAALHWYRRLVGMGFRPLLTESNGRGGYHLRGLLAEPLDGARVFYLLKRLTADHKRLGLPKAPEQFPKQPDVRRCRKGLGNWLRLPGRHHKRDFWSRVWDGGRWLDGTGAVAFILALKCDPPSLVPDLPPPAPPQPLHCQVHISRAGDNLPRRIAAYVARVPNAGKGQGRDDLAFSLACWLVRDMALADDVALAWLCRWDAGNSPPKGEAVLREIMRNAHTYGRATYGCGRPPQGLRRDRHGQLILTSRGRL
jgi:hypothetical protein